jgi:hypothetical protein
LEELFEKKDTKKAAVGEKPSEEQKVVVPEVPALLDGKRTSNLGIMLSQFGQLTPEDIGDAIRRCDMDILTNSRIKSLCNFLPTEEESEVLTSFTGDKSKQSKAERFYLEIIHIPRLEQRLKLLQFRFRSEELVEYVTPGYNTVITATEEIHNSKTFKKILELVLAIGNYLNGGTAQGGAYGFKLDVLSKIRDFKSMDNKATLFSYVVTKLKAENLIQKLVEEMKSIFEAQRLPLSALNQDALELSKGLNDLTREIKLLTNSIGGGEGAGGQSMPLDKSQISSVKKFLAVLNPFFADFEVKCKIIDEKKVKCEKLLEDVMTEFQEDPKKVPSEEFFEIFSKFVSSLDVLI